MLPYYGKNTDKKYLFIKVNISPPTNKIEGDGACLREPINIPHEARHRDLLHTVHIPCASIHIET